MTIPSFTAEATLYGSSKQYRQRGPTTRMHAGTSVVRPQDCGFFKGFVCAGGVVGAIATCADACVVTGGTACYGCIVAALAVLGIGGCADCIPTQFVPGGEAGEAGAAAAIGSVVSETRGPAGASSSSLRADNAPKKPALLGNSSERMKD